MLQLTTVDENTQDSEFLYQGKDGMLMSTTGETVTLADLGIDTTKGVEITSVPNTQSLFDEDNLQDPSELLNEMAAGHIPVETRSTPTPGQDYENGDFSDENVDIDDEDVGNVTSKPTEVSSSMVFVARTATEPLPQIQRPKEGKADFLKTHYFTPKYAGKIKKTSYC